MSGASRKSERQRLTCQRIAVDAQGYDRTGAYWGAGPDVFIVTTADGRDEIAVRAKSVAEARTKATAELDRKPDQPRVKEPLGGTSPHKTRYEIDWRDPATGATVRIRITHSRDYLSQGSDHVEVESLRPKHAPLPITDTGYRSHFMPALDLMNAGGPVSFVEGWLAREAKGKAWSKAATGKTQGDLFQWAETQAEVGRTRAKPKALSAAKPKRRRTTPDQSPE